MPARASGAKLPVQPVSTALRAPRYHQVQVALRGWIVDGTLQPGARLPPEPELCAAFEVSRITIRRAIDELVASGLVRRRQGSGTFVAPGPRRAKEPLDLREISRRVTRIGRATEVVELRSAWVVPDPETRAALEVGPDARVHKSVRVRAHRGERIGLVTAWVREDVGRKLRKGDLRRATVLELIERMGIEVASAEQTVGATLAGIEAARALAVPVGTLLVRIERVARAADGGPVERVEVLWRADAYHYSMSLTRVRRGALSGWVAD